MIMMDAVINISSERFYEDKKRIDVSVDEITRAGCNIFYQFVNTVNDKIIVETKTNISFYNYESKKKLVLIKIRFI